MIVTQILSDGMAFSVRAPDTPHDETDAEIVSLEGGWLYTSRNPLAVTVMYSGCCCSEPDCEGDIVGEVIFARELLLESLLSLTEVGSGEIRLLHIGGSEDLLQVSIRYTEPGGDEEFYVPMVVPAGPVRAWLRELPNLVEAESSQEEEVDAAIRAILDGR